jgi:hypothetical protein
MIKLVAVFAAIVATILTGCRTDSTKTLNEETNLTQVPKIKVPTSLEHGMLQNVSSGCGFSYNFKSDSLELSLPSYREQEEVKRILSYIGLPMNFDIYSAEIQNAVATSIDGKRMIIYDPKLLRYADHVSKTYWASMSILTHEIGHHLAGHIFDAKKNSHQAELEADKFSGHVLYKMGATLSETLIAMSLLGGENSSETHPAKKKRLEAIKEGWNQSLKLRYEGAIPPPPDDITDTIGSITEFSEKDLLEKSQYDEAYNNFIKVQYGGAGLFSHQRWEGIITDVDNNLSGIEVFITKVGKDDKEYHPGLQSQKIWVIVTATSNLNGSMSRAASSWLDEALKPGRRIRFGFISEGNAPFYYLGYLKVLPGNSF